MFSAIVTAMLGAFWLGALGILDLSLVAVPETYLWPQLVGGLVFGVGFVIGGLLVVGALPYDSIVRLVERAEARARR